MTVRPSHPGDAMACACQRSFALLGGQYGEGLVPTRGRNQRGASATTASTPLPVRVASTESDSASHPRPESVRGCYVMVTPKAGDWELVAPRQRRRSAITPPPPGRSSALNVCRDRGERPGRTRGEADSTPLGGGNAGQSFWGIFGFAGRSGKKLHPRREGGMLPNFSTGLFRPVWAWSGKISRWSARCSRLRFQSALQGCRMTGTSEGR